MPFDLILRGGRVIDPSQKLDAVTDVAFARGKVVMVGSELKADPGTDVRDVSGYLAEKRRGGRHLGIHAELGSDQLDKPQEGIALPVGEVDRLVHDPSFHEALQSTDDAVDAVVDVGEVEDLLPAVDGDGLAARQAVNEERDYPHHPVKVVVETTVDVRESKDEIRQRVTAGVRIDERLAGNL